MSYKCLGRNYEVRIEGRLFLFFKIGDIGGGGGDVLVVGGD